MLTVAVASLKGGSGKTTLSVNLAASWAGKRTVGFVDLDPQGNATHSLAHLTTQGEGTAASTLLAAADDPHFLLSPQAWSTVTFTDGSGFYLLPTPDADELSEATERLATKPFGEQALQRALLTAQGLDVVVLDTAPSISRLTWNAVVAAHSIFGVTTPHRWAIEGAAQMKSLVDDANEFGRSTATWEGVILNKDGGRKTQVNKATRKLLAASGLHMLDATVPQRVSVEESEFIGVPVVMSDPKSAAGKALNDVAKEAWRLASGKAKKKGKGAA